MLLLIYGERQRHRIMPRTKSCEGMDVSGDDPDLAITVLTCEGDLRDPAFPTRLTQIICKLKHLLSDDHKKPFQVTKVEPWNSVRVTFNIPRNAAQRLRQLAERGDNTLRELGILSVQIEGDQVITLTLANSFNESREQLLIGKSSENVVNSAGVVVSSAVNSSAININSSELTVNYNSVNSLTSSSSVSSVVSAIDLIGSPQSGSSVEITRKNIAQYLSQQHLDVVKTTSNPNPNSVEPISDRLPAFRSPNVVAPINTEPIPYLNSSPTSAVSSQLSTCVSSTVGICTASASAGSRLSAVTSIANSSVRELQSNYGLFPFASMQHSYQARHTKQALTASSSHYTSVQRPNPVITTPSVRLPLTFGQTQPSQSIANSTGTTPPAATVSSTNASSVSNRPQPTPTRDAKSVKVCQSVSSQSQPSPAQTIAVAQAVGQSGNAPNSASANVALTSPLLVNLLQSDATSGHLKGSTPQTSSLNPLNALNDLPPKRKPRKTRKQKERVEPEVTQSSYFVNTSAATLTSAQSSPQTTNVSTTQSTSPSLKHLPSNPLPPQSPMDSQMQTQSAFNTSPHLISIPISAMSTMSTISAMSAMSRFPSIHPEAQGQPQVVRAAHLPLRAQLSRPQIAAAKVGSPPISTTHLRKPLFVTTCQAPSSKPLSTATVHSKPLHEQKSSPNPNPNSANSKAVTEANAVFPSPPTSRMSGKTKHLINPFTGLLEPMLSDEEEEDRPSPATIFPELEGSDVGGNSERSLSDAGSNGKENNHSSDTDSGLGKSGTDVSSQSSIDVGNGDNTQSHSKACVPTNEGISSSSDSPIDRLKLKLKIEAKNELTSKSDPFPTTSSLNASFLSRSHFTKQKSSEPSNPSSNPCVSTTQPSDPIPNPVVMAEPRVPPLHISIRGPNSAVVVSNRRESTSEIEMKTTAPKKARGVRTTRAMSVESGLGTECTNLNKNQRKKLQREQRFLSGGGIVTSNSSLCASAASAQSLVDITKTLNDSALALGSGSSLHSSESVDTLFLQSSDVSPNCAQNDNKPIDSNDSNDKNIDISVNTMNTKNNNTNNSKNINISQPNKCVPHLNNDDNSSQLCAIRVSTDSSLKPSVLSKDETIVKQTNSDLVSLNTTVPTVNCVSDSLGSNVLQESDSNIGKSDFSSTPKPMAPTNQNKCHSNNEVTNSEPLQCEPEVSSAPTDNHKEISVNETEKLLEKSKPKPRKLPVASVVTVEPLMSANTETVVNKISRIGRNNCIANSIPALVNTRELNCARNTSALRSSERTLLHNYLNESTIEEECMERIETNETTISSVAKINSNVNKIVDKSSKSIAVFESKPTDISIKSEIQSQMTKSDVVLNGDISCNSNESPTPSPDSPKSKPNSEIQCIDSSIGHELNDSSEPQINSLVKTEGKQNDLIEKNDSKSECQSNQTEILSENKSKENIETKAMDSKQSVSLVSETPINADNSNHSVSADSQSTAISDDTLQTKPKSPEITDSDKELVLKAKDSDSDSEVKTSNESVAAVDTTSASVAQNKSSEETKSSEVKCVSNDESPAKQPLQIVITTGVPSLTTTTSTAMFPHLKGSTGLETGSRVTLITFKPNLNSPNHSANSGGKASDFSSSALSSQMPSKGVPFKLLTIPSGSGGITVRSAANKLVELINSTASSPVSPLSPNQLSSGGSPMSINTTSPPVRLLVSKVATAGSVTQTGVPVSVSGNSIGQLVVVKSVVVTNPSPSIKLVPAKNPSINSMNTPSLLIPVTRTNSPIESLNACNNNIEQKANEPKESTHLLIPSNEINNCVQNDDNSGSDSYLQNQDSDSGDNDLPQLEPVDLTVACLDSHSLSSSGDETKAEDNSEDIPRLIKSSNVSQNESLSDEEGNDDNNPLTHSVASDHNYIMKQSSSEFEDQEIEESVLNLSNTTETDILDAFRDNDVLNDETYNDFQSDHISEEESKQCKDNDHQSRPNKRKSSENAAELIKACMGVEDSHKKNTSVNCSPLFSAPSSVSSTRTPNMSGRTRTTSVDNDCLSITTCDHSEANHLNKSKNLRIRKSKVSSTEPVFTPDNNCSNDEEIGFKDSSGLSWSNKPRLRTGTTGAKTQKLNKQKNMNCIKDSNKEKIGNRSTDRTKKGRDRDQSKTCSTQRSTRRSRDHNIMISSADINLHSSESSSEPLHMEIVGLELSNDSSTNNYNNTDPSTASTPSPIITSSLLVKRKTRVGLNNNTEQTDSSLTKRRRIVKENHR